MDIKTAMQISEDSRPHTRARIAWLEGGGETLWVKTIDPSTAMLCNVPLDARYRLFDLVRVDPTSSPPAVKEIVHRVFVREMAFEIDLGSTADEARQEQRKAVLEAGKAAGGMPGFFMETAGYVLLPRGVEVTAVEQALRDTNVPFTRLSEHP